MIDLIVFDLAGTTVKENFDVQRVLKNSFEKVGLSISIEQANKVMGIPKPAAITQLLELLNYPIISTAFVEQIHTDFVSSMISFYEQDATVEENQGVSDTFRKLKEHGIKVMVDTGFDRPIVKALLTRMAWQVNGLIDGSIASDEVENGRPHPDMILKAMKLFDITDAKRVAKVGDTLSDLGEGTAAGCGFVIGITSGAFTREQLAAAPHTHIIQHIPEVLNIVGIKS